MDQLESDKKTKVLRFIWGSFPWFVVVILILSLFILSGKIKEKSKRLEEENKAAVKEEVSVQVVTLTVEPAQLEETLNLPATVESFENLWVKSEAAGQVTNILVREGQTVQKGQILVELDSRDYTTNLERIDACIARHDRYMKVQKP